MVVHAWWSASGRAVTVAGAGQLLGQIHAIGLFRVSLTRGAALRLGFGAGTPRALHACMNRILLFAAGLALGLVIVPTWTRLSRAVAAEVLSCDRDVGSRVADVLRLEAMEADTIDVSVRIEGASGVAIATEDGVADDESQGHTRTFTFDRSVAPYLVQTCAERSWRWPGR